MKITEVFSLTNYLDAFSLAIAFPPQLLIVVVTFVIVIIIMSVFELFGGKIVAIVIVILRLVGWGVINYNYETTGEGFIQENREQFLKDAGVRFVELEKYKESKRISTEEGLKERYPVYEGQKIKNIHIAHLLKDSSEKTPEIKIELENGATFIVEDGESVIPDKFEQEDELYFFLKLNRFMKDRFSKKDNHWVISPYQYQVELISGKEELDEVIKDLNSQGMGK